MRKVYASAEAAIQDIEDGAVLMGWFWVVWDSRKFDCGVGKKGGEGFDMYIKQCRGG